MAFGEEDEWEPTSYFLRSFCKIEVLPAGSFSPFHTQNVSS